MSRFTADLACSLEIDVPLARPYVSLGVLCKLLAASVLLFSLPQNGLAADGPGSLTVTSNATSGSNTLPWAVDQINSFYNGGTIGFSLGAGSSSIISACPNLEISGGTLSFVNNNGTTPVTVNFGVNYLNAGTTTTNLGSNLTLLGTNQVLQSTSTTLSIGTTTATIVTADTSTSGSFETVTIYNNSDISIGVLGGSVSATSPSSYAHVAGVYGGGSVTINELTGTVTAVGAGYIADGINGRTITINKLSGTVVALNSAPDWSVACGIAGDSAVNITELSGSVSATAMLATANGILSYGSIHITDLSGTVSAVSGTAARAIADTPEGHYGGITLKVADTGVLYAAATDSANAFAIYDTGSLADTVELVAGCQITGNMLFNTSGSNSLTLSGSTGSTTLGGSITNATTVDVVGGTWNINSFFTNNSTLNSTGGIAYFNGTTAGSATVYNGGVLGGTGTLGELTNEGGIVAPGNSIGTLHVTGNFTNSSTGRLNIQINSAGDCDKIAVGGTATIQGGTVNVLAASGTYASGMTYKFLTAGSVSGTFNGVTDDLAFFDASLIYGSDYAAILLTGNGSNYDSQAATPNQHAVAQTLDRTSGTATGDYGTVLSNVNTLDGTGTRQAFGSMGGEIHSSAATVAVENQEQTTTTVNDHLNSQTNSNFDDGDVPCGGINTGIETIARSLMILTSSSTDDNYENLIRYCNREEAAVNAGWTTWGQGYGIGSNLASDGNASGLTYSTGGVIVGVDRLFWDNTKIGFAGGYSSTNLTLEERGDNASIDGGNASIYLRHEFESFYVNSIVGYSHNNYATTRYIDFANIDRTAHANYGGNNFSFYDEIGRMVRVRNMIFQPYAGLEYINVHQDAFTESGADSIDLVSGGEQSDAFRSMLGLRAFATYRKKNGHAVVFQGHATWRHEFLNENRVLDAAFDGVSGSAFAVTGINVDRDAAILGVGTAYEIRQGFSVFGRYDAMTSQNYTAHIGSAGVEYQW